MIGIQVFRMPVLSKSVIIALYTILKTHSKITEGMHKYGALSNWNILRYNTFSSWALTNIFIQMILSLVLWFYPMILCLNSVRENPSQTFSFMLYFKIQNFIMFCVMISNLWAFLFSLHYWKISQFTWFTQKIWI